MDRMKCALEIQKWYVLLDPKKAMRTLKFREEDRHQEKPRSCLFGCDDGEKKKPHLIKNQLKERSYQKKEVISINSISYY